MEYVFEYGLQKEACGVNIYFKKGWYVFTHLCESQLQL